MKNTNSNPDSEWWEPFWKSLIMNGTGDHVKKMGNAIWLFLYLLLHADQASGSLMRKVKTISSDMGVPIRTITRWLAHLRNQGYIETSNTGRDLAIVISLWKTLWKAFHDKPQAPHQVSQGELTRSDNPGNCGQPQSEKEEAKITQKSKNGDSPIDNDNLFNKLKNDTEKYPQNPKPKDPRRERHIAYELANSLKDHQSFPLYLSYAQKYPEQFLRKILAAVLEVPPEKISKTRGALFNYLIQKYGPNLAHHPGD